MPAMETLNEHINNLLKFLKAKRKTDLSKAQHKPEVSELLIRAQLLHIEQQIITNLPRRAKLV